MKLSPKVFNHKHPFTIGVEEEYMLCNPKTGDLVDKVDVIMDLIDPSDNDRFSYELIKTEVEINTPVCQDVEQAMGEIRRLRNIIRDIGKQNNFRMGISGTHPTAKPIEQNFVSAPGYQWVANQMGYYAQRNIPFATHVHVAVPDAESAIHITNAMRRWIGPLLAISTNSPFFEGVKTGMLSSRSFQFGAFPRTNVPITFESYDQYKDLVNSFIDMGSIEKPRQIWWKIRPSMDFGTIEFRMFDIQRSLIRTRLLIALSQSLVHRAWSEFKDGTLAEDFRLDYIDDCYWKASRFGFDVKVMDPKSMDILSMEEFILRMVDYAEPALKYFNNMDVIDTVKEILEIGSEAIEQKQVYKSAGMSGLQKFLMDNVQFN